MSTGAIPTPQQLPAQIPQSLHQQPQPQTPNIPHPQQIQGVPGHYSMQMYAPSQAQLPVHPNAHVQQIMRQRRMFAMQEQQQLAAAAARSGVMSSSVTPAMMSATQQDISAQPAMLVNRIPNKPGPPGVPQHSQSAQPQSLPQQPQQQGAPQQVPRQQQHVFAVPSLPPQRTQFSGQAVLRLLQFADLLGADGATSSQDYWDQFVHDFFTPWAIFKFVLFNTLKNIHEYYELMQTTLTSYFCTQYQCDIVSVQLTFERAREKFQPDGSATVECERASMVQRFKDGSMVMLRGPLSVVFRRIENAWKVDVMKFTCNEFEEYISRARVGEIVASVSKTAKSKQSKQNVIPQTESSVNECGLPTRLYEHLKLLDNLNRMDEIMIYSLITQLSARESLNSLAQEANTRLSDGGVVSAGGGGKIRSTKRGSKSKEERQKLTRQKPSRTKQSSANSTKAENTGTEVTFVTDPSPVVKTQSAAATNTPNNVPAPATMAVTPMQAHNQLAMQSLPYHAMQQHQVGLNPFQQQQAVQNHQQRLMWHQQQLALQQHQQHAIQQLHQQQQQQQALLRQHGLATPSLPPQATPTTYQQQHAVSYPGQPPFAHQLSQ